MVKTARTQNTNYLDLLQWRTRCKGLRRWSIEHISHSLKIIAIMAYADKKKHKYFISLFAYRNSIKNCGFKIFKEENNSNYFAQSAL